MQEYYEAICENCSQFRGFSNTGYWCNIDKVEVDECSSCRCFDLKYKEE